MPATSFASDNLRTFIARSAVQVGEVWQMRDGRAGVYTGLAAAATNQEVTFTTEGQWTIPKTVGITLLDGGPVYWDHSAQAATFRKVNDRDFYIGTLVGDAIDTAATCVVDFNVKPVYTVDLLRDPANCTLVLTAGTPKLEMIGGSAKLTFSATNEAQKVDLISRDGFSPLAKSIVEFAVRIADDGDAGAIDFNFGLANGTHASDADSIAESLFIHTDGDSTTIKAESDDGTVEVAATDTTKVYVLGTRFEVWYDLRDPSDIQIYIDGILVLPSTVFKLNLATGPVYLIVHLEKSADDTLGEYWLEWGRARLAQQ